MNIRSLPRIGSMLESLERGQTTTPRLHLVANGSSAVTKSPIAPSPTLTKIKPLLGFSRGAVPYSTPTEAVRPSQANIASVVGSFVLDL
jgi:hypothetical protein